jgi:zinc/manganese transport system substrate-binding protein
MVKVTRLTLIFLLALVLVGPAHIRAQAQKLRVVTSTTILLDLAKNVAGDKADLASIVPTDGDPHEFEPTPSDIKALSDADLILVNGLGLELFLDKLIKDSGTKARIVTLTDGVPIRHFNQSGGAPTQANMPPGILGFGGLYQCGAPRPGEEMGECDPHGWQDPTNVILYTLNIRDALIAADAANAATYRANAALYIARLQQLDAEIWQNVATIPAKNRILVTNHDSLGYFAARYGFKLVGVVLPGGTASEPSPQELAALVSTIKAQSIPAIFTENISNNKLASEIAAQTGVKVVQSLYTDALGAAGSPGETYLGMMRANARAITAALGGSA